MFQSFDDPGGAHLGRTHLPLLRRRLKALGLSGFIVPHEDEYQNEYIPAAYDRLLWLTGFTGSAGMAIVLAERAALFVDGRYTLQAKAQVDAGLFALESLTENGGASGWLAKQSLNAATLGYDPRLHTPDGLERLRAAAAKAGAELAPVAPNPIDEAWGQARPPLPCAPVLPHAERYAGESAAAKRTRIGAVVAEAGAEALVITDPCSIAWLFNIRGGDVRAAPLPLAQAILYADGGAELFLEPEKRTEGLDQWLGDGVALAPESALPERLAALARKTVMLDPALASAWHFATLEAAGARIVRAADPIALPRAQKNETEIAGAYLAHRRDGAALTRFLHWLAGEAGQSGRVDEIETVRVLEGFRREAGAVDISFDAISGAGPNGAIVHYRVTTKTNRKLKRGNLFLIDSGGQYPEGTTDVTRTIAIGRPSPEMKDRFTRVLKGHIALARIRFPEGTTGSQLDALARAALWEAGLDYEHGTGHGVGSYLSVHEGPQRIGKPGNAVALLPGMIISNEPGYYKSEAYGIRVENLQLVLPPKAIDGGEKEMLGFDSLTLAPIDRRLILRQLLSPAERAWLDAYHARVRAELAERVPANVAAWLEEACAPI